MALLSPRRVPGHPCHALRNRQADRQTSAGRRVSLLACPWETRDNPIAGGRPRAELCSPSPIECLYGQQGRGRGSQSVIDTPASESPHEELGIGRHEVDGISGWMWISGLWMWMQWMGRYSALCVLIFVDAPPAGERANRPHIARATLVTRSSPPAQYSAHLSIERICVPPFPPRAASSGTPCSAHGRRGGEGRPHTAYSISQILHTAW